MKMAGRSKNLLKNPCAKDGLNYWEYVCQGGDGFKCEQIPEACQDIRKCSMIRETLPCWSTSHDLCEKKQLVDLREHGFSAAMIDEKKPPITVQDWYAPRLECGCEYMICALLLADDKETELDKWQFAERKAANSDWSKIQHVFKDYPSGVRYVEFKHGGEDEVNWAGHFGVKMTNSGVFVGTKLNNKTKRKLRAVSGKNLLRNPCGMSNLDGWQVVCSGGDGFKCEKDSEGSKPVKEAIMEAQESSCWATSYENCEKKQLIDLSYNGFDWIYMDEIQPHIQFSEWFGSRSDAGCKYWLKVRLLNKDLEEVTKKEFNESKDSSGEWFKVCESFSNYGPGVRFIEYIHGGRDSNGWEGHYGAKITCSFVAVNADIDLSSSASSSDDE